MTEDPTTDATDKEYYDDNNQYDALADTESIVENSELTSNDDITNYTKSILLSSSSPSSPHSNRKVSFHPQTKYPQ